jgi:hypothetical protein
MLKFSEWSRNTGARWRGLLHEAISIPLVLQVTEPFGSLPLERHCDMPLYGVGYPHSIEVKVYVNVEWSHSQYYVHQSTEQSSVNGAQSALEE